MIKGLMGLLICLVFLCLGGLVEGLQGFRRVSLFQQEKIDFSQLPKATDLSNNEVVSIYVKDPFPEPPVLVNLKNRRKELLEKNDNVFDAFVKEDDDGFPIMGKQEEQELRALMTELYGHLNTEVERLEGQILDIHQLFVSVDEQARNETKNKGNIHCEAANGLVETAFLTREMKLFDPSRLNSLMSTLDFCYRWNRALVLTPDDFLLPLLQALTALKKSEPGEFRVTRNEFDMSKDTFRSNDWGGVLKELGSRIEIQVGEEEYLYRRGEFSTTKKFQHIAYDVASMNSFLRAPRTHFSYTVKPEFGIAELTLEGTQEDWNHFRDNALHIVDEIVEHTHAEHALEWKAAISVIIGMVSRDSDNATFWSRIYHFGSEMEDGSDGWINLFFPVVIDRRNDQFRFGSIEDILGEKELINGRRVRDLSTFPSSISSVAAQLKNKDKWYALRIGAGQVGMTQDKDGRIHPAFGYCINAV